MSQLLFGPAFLSQVGLLLFLKINMAPETSKP